MRGTLVLPGIIIASVIIAGLLFLYGSPVFHQTITTDNAPRTQNEIQGWFQIIAQGQNANTIDQRVNYRITNAQDMAALWNILYPGGDPPVPTIDFSKYEVLAIFDGSHSSGGYSVGIDKVSDAEGKRMIQITHITPGDHCTVSDAQTSPFIIIQVKHTNLVMDHVEATQTKDCP